MTEAADALNLLADGLALLYHEARHVRFLIKAGHLSSEGWDPFMKLPRNRVEAWRAVLPVRQAAAHQTGATAAAAVFEARFGRSPEDLEALYRDSHWRHATAVGGHAWREVAARALALRDAINANNPAAVSAACTRLLNARHNNGLLRDKILELDGTLGIDTHDLWKESAAGA